MPKFCERLRTLRTNKGLSQQDFAKQLGISKSSVNMYERGEREPSFEMLELIADYFNVDMDYLLGKSEFTNKFQWLQIMNSSQSATNVLKIAGRDGSYQEHAMTDDETEVLKDRLNDLPEPPDDLG